MKTHLFCFIVIQTIFAVSAQYRVVCYYGTWATYRQGNGKFDVNNIDPRICTHIIYSFLGTDETGNVKYLDPYLDLSESWGKGYINKFTALRSISPNTKFLMSIGGWNAGSNVFSKIAASPSLQETFAQNVLDILMKHNFDGFDFDWELSANGKSLSIAVAATKSSAFKSYDIPNVSLNVDFINLMTYDLHGSWDRLTGINAPLFAGPRDVTPFQKELNVDASVKAWIAGGAPRNKLVVGIPLYGRSFTLNNPNNHDVGAPAIGAGQAGIFTSEAGFMGYNEICYNIKNNGWDSNWDSSQKVPYAFKGNQWVGYDDVNSVRAKAKYIQDNQLGGGMFWSIETDDFANICGGGKYPLIKAAYDILVENVPLPESSSSASSQNTPTIPPIQASTQQSSTSKPNSELKCLSANGLFKDPTDCRKFYNCAGGTAHSQSCPLGLLYNVNGYCDWPDNVDC